MKFLQALRSITLKITANVAASVLHICLMYMPSFIAVSVVVFKLLPVKVWQPTYLCFSAVQIEDFVNFKTL